MKIIPRRDTDSTNLLGVGSLAAAIAVKDYLKEHKLAGTVQYFGCPAEESGYGKTFMARDGLFKDVDAAFPAADFITFKSLMLTFSFILLLRKCLSKLLVGN